MKNLIMKLDTRALIAGVIIATLAIPLAMVGAANSHSADFELSSSQYLSITDGNQTGLDGLTDFTIELWYKPESADSGFDHSLVSKWGTSTGNRSYQLQYFDDSGTNKLSLAVTDGSSTAYLQVAKDLGLGVWMHIAVTYDASAGQAEFFVNGTSIGTANGGPSSVNNGTDPFFIGADNSQTGENPTNWIDGRMDDVRLWNDIRTEAEIANNLQSELVGTENNLVGYWKLNNDTNDNTSNNNDLTNNNSATFVADTPFEDASETVVLKALKSGDETVTSSTTLQNDDDLSASVSADTDYIVDGVLFVKSASSDPDIKIAFDVPTGATMDIGYIAAAANNRNTAELLETDATASGSILVGRNNAPTIIRLAGSIQVSSTAGNVILQWAQDNSDTDGVTVMEGSYLRLEEI